MVEKSVRKVVEESVRKVVEESVIKVVEESVRKVVVMVKSGANIISLEQWQISRPCLHILRRCLPTLSFAAAKTVPVLESMPTSRAKSLCLLGIKDTKAFNGEKTVIVATCIGESN